MKKKIKIFILALVAVFSLLIARPVIADSGFDSDYGGSSNFGSSSSDWGSSSSSWSSDSSSYDWDDDYSSSSSSSNHSSSSPEDDYIAIIMIIIIMTVFIYLMQKQSSSKMPASIDLKLDHSLEMSEENIKKILPDYNKKAFVDARYNDFIRVQNAWTKFDYDTLRNSLTDELYNQYEMQLETLKAAGEVNEMNDFNMQDAMVTNITDENNEITVTMEFIIGFYDYITKDGKLEKGSDKKKIYQHYEMKFVCNKDSKIDVCPNCGAKLTDAASQKCEYCGSVITNISKKFVLSKKESKGQR